MSFYWLLLLIAFFGGVTAQRLTPKAKRWKGRHISKPLIRMIGHHRAVVLWETLTAFEVGFWIGMLLGGSFKLWAITLALRQSRHIDDWLYSDDDDDRRDDRFRARVRLKMPAPVRLRPAERWSGA